MATVNKDFKIKAGLIVEGTNGTINGSDIITEDAIVGGTQTNISVTYNSSTKTVDFVAENGVADSTTDDLTEGTTNLYFTNSRALTATASAYDAAGSAATAQSNAEDYADTAIAAAVSGLAPNYITSTTTEFSVTNGELSFDQINGSAQINPSSGNQPNNGYGTLEYVDTEAGTEGLKIKSERGWVGDQFGGQLDIDAYRGLNLTSRNGDIVLNADGDTYLGSVGAGNDVATTGYVDGLAANYDPAGSAATVAGDLSTHILDTSAHGVTGDVVGTTDTQTLSNKTITSLTITDTGSYIEGDSGNVTLHAGQDLTLSSTSGDIIFAPDGNVFIGASGTAGNQVATHDYADGVANTAQTNAESYVNAQLTNYTTTANLDTTVGGYGYIKSAALSGYATESYVGTAISNLVDSAPDTLNTLNELAAALNDDASFSTTIATSIGEKVAKSGDTMTGFLTLSAAPTNDLHAATKKYVDDAIGGVTNISEVVLPDALLGSETATAGTSSTVVDSWSATTYSTAKYLVQMKSGSNIHVLEVLVTVDGSNNVYVTEYAEVVSNTSLGTTDAAYNAGDVEFTVTAANAGTSVKISKTLIEA